MKKNNDGSWISHFIVPQHEKALPPGTEAKSSQQQQIFSKQVVQKNSDPRSLLTVTSSKLFNDMDPVFFDPELDPPYKGCFNCWRGGDSWSGDSKTTRHNHYFCSEPPLHEFCENCGRRGVDVSVCPRCARGYREFVKRGCKTKSGHIWRPMPKPLGAVVKEVSSFRAADGRSSGSSRKSRSFDVNVDDDFTFRSRREEATCKQEESLSKSGTIDEASGLTKDEAEDEDYDDIIVDEDARSETSSSINGIIDDFLRMLDNTKCLPIPDQSSKVLQFIKKRREQIEKSS